MAFLWQLVLLKVVFPAQELTVVFLQSMSKPAECEEVVTHDATTFTHTQFSWFLTESPAGHLSLWLYCTFSFLLSLSLLSVSCSLVQLLRVFTSLCYWSGALSSSNTPRSWLYGMFYDRLCVRCLHVCCWDVWRVLVGGTTGGEMTVNQ